MSRARSRRASTLATLVVAALALGGLGSAPQAAADPQPPAPESSAGTPTDAPTDTDEATPLSVEMTSMNPAAIPERGPLVIRGVVTNSSEEEWTEVSVAPFLSATPLTTRADLARAAATEETEVVGSRLRDPATYVAVGDLAPGDSRTFAITVPRDSISAEISGAPGVYWIGVHALGSNADGRDEVADGRARSFIPLLSPADRRRSVDVALVIPFRERGRRAADGSLNGPARWRSLTAPDGRLSRIAELAATAGGVPVTWSVDPAVLDALEDLGRGNPRLSLGNRRRAQTPTDPSAGPAPSSGQPSSDPSSDPSASPTGDPDEQDSGAPLPEDDLSVQARQVLRTFQDAARRSTVLAVPYGDPDVAAVLRRDPALLARAQMLAAQRSAVHGLAAVPVVAPPDALFDPALTGDVAPSTTFLLDGASPAGTSPFARLATGQPLVLSDPGASDGGPGPTEPGATLAMRQRILADASLGLADGTPIVVRFPMRWQPGAYWREADLFGALRRSWIRLVPVSTGGASTYAGTLSYTRKQRAQEVSADNVGATLRLIRTGDTLAGLLANTNAVAGELAGAALQASAYSARQSPRLAAEQVRALDTSMRSTMRRVQVTGTDFVTLAGGSGTLTVTLVNGLDQPVDVGLRSRADDPGVQVESSAPVRLAPGERTTLPLTVRSTTGVHEVTMYPVTRGQQSVGRPLTFSVRTSQVGVVVWYVLGGGCLLLVVMILRRIVWRVRNRRWRLEDAP